MPPLSNEEEVKAARTNALETPRRVDENPAKSITVKQIMELLPIFLWFLEQFLGITIILMELKLWTFSVYCVVRSEALRVLLKNN